MLLRRGMTSLASAQTSWTKALVVAWKVWVVQPFVILVQQSAKLVQNKVQLVKKKNEVWYQGYGIYTQTACHKTLQVGALQGPELPIAKRHMSKTLSLFFGPKLPIPLLSNYSFHYLIYSLILFHTKKMSIMFFLMRILSIVTWRA